MRALRQRLVIGIGAAAVGPTAPMSGRPFIGPILDGVIDPSVMVEEEPSGCHGPGALTTMVDDARLCDRVDGACGSVVAAGGIDPALVAVPDGSGHVLGRVRDGEIADLQFVPHPGGTR